METFRQYLTDQVGNYLQLGRSGPEACQGRLVHLGRDYLTLCCFDGTRLHFPLHHVRSVTPFPYTPQPDDPPSAPDEAWPETCGERLASLVGERVLVNHAGPESSSGTLVAATDELLLLEIAPGERVCLARFHLRSFCLHVESPEGVVAACIHPQS